jgi:hypothetical protein
MDHNYNNDANFIAKKEWLINFLDNFEINKNHNATPQQNCKNFFDANVVNCANSLSLKQIKQIFRANKNRNNYFNNEYLNIAVHIRRPNSHDVRPQGSDTPNRVFLNIIKKLRRIYSKKKPLFHVYSQGSRENFKIFEASDVILHLNEPIEDTFIAMVFADVLVAGTSSFSYAAGLLSEGIVYYIPFWHTPLPQWKNAITSY